MNKKDDKWYKSVCNVCGLKNYYHGKKIQMESSKTCKRCLLGELIDVGVSK